jgi:hypothetical protein
MVDNVGRLFSTNNQPSVQFPSCLWRQIIFSMAASLGELVAKSRKTILLALAILAGTLVISRVELSQHMSPLRISSKQSASELTTEVARRLAVWEAGPVWAHDDAIHANRLGCKSA